MNWQRTSEHVAHRRLGIIEGVVFGSPDKNPKSYTWQLYVMTGYFAAGSAPTLEEAAQAAEIALTRAVAEINNDFFTDMLPPEPVADEVKHEPQQPER